MSDGFVQVQTEGAGKRVDATPIVVPDATASPPTIYRQRIALGDAVESDLLAAVGAALGGLALMTQDVAVRRLLEDQVLSAIPERVGMGDRITGERYGTR